MIFLQGEYFSLCLDTLALQATDNTWAVGLYNILLIIAAYPFCILQYLLVSQSLFTKAG